MDPQTIKEIADQIADQTILTSWKVWGLQFALWLTGTFGVAYAAAYLAKRGEHKAIAADFESLKNQLKENTATVKTIETEIGHADWAKREWKTIQRIKLEELMLGIHATVEWAETRSKAVFDEGTGLVVAHEAEKVSMLAELYIRDLSLSVTKFLYIQSSIAVILTNAEMIKSKGNAVSVKDAVEFHALRDNFQPLFNELYEVSHELEQAAAKVMRTIVGV